MGVSGQMKKKWGVFLQLLFAWVYFCNYFSKRVYFCYFTRRIVGRLRYCQNARGSDSLAVTGVCLDGTNETLCCAPTEDLRSNGS